MRAEEILQRKKESVHRAAKMRRVSAGRNKNEQRTARKDEEKNEEAEK